MSIFILQQFKFFYSEVVAWEKSQILEESSDSDYQSENDRVSEFESLKESLNNHKIEWPQSVDESECSNANSSFYLASITECCEESHESDQVNVGVRERKVKVTKGRKIDEAEMRLEEASGLLDDGKISLTRFLKMLDQTGEWFPENSKFSFEFDEKNVEINTIELIMKNYYGPDWSSPFHFEFNSDIEA